LFKIIRISTFPDSLNIHLKGQLNFLSNFFTIVGVSGPGIKLKELGEREKIKVLPIRFERKISPFVDLISLIKLFLLFRKEKPLIVHSITPKAGLLSMVAAFFAKVPIRIHTFTGLIFPSKSGLMQKLLIISDKILCYCATNIYPEGSGVMRDLITFGITNKKLKVIANGNINGVNIEYFNPDIFSMNFIANFKKELNISKDEFIFLYVGRLVGDKGINELVEAFYRLHNFKCKLLLVGSFESNLDRLNPSALIEIKENPNIKYVGFQKDVRPFLAISDVFVFPSYREGFPNAVLQAGAMGLPCIVTNINGNNEIIQNGVNGIIIPSKNIDALVSSMRLLYENKHMRDCLKLNARSLILEKFDQKIVWKSQLDEYEILIQNHFSLNNKNI